MSERNQMANVTKSGSKKTTWTLVIAGTAVLLLGAGVMLQLMRPTPAYPDSAPGKAQLGNSQSGDSEGRKTRRVAKVGKEYITEEELARECMVRLGKEVLDDLINRKIVQQACDVEGIQVSEGEVSKEVERMAKKFGFAVDQYLQMLETERNISPMRYRRDIIWPMLALRKLAGEEVKVTEADVKKAFERNYGPRVEARAIVLDNPRRAREVWDKIQKNPENFERLAREFSIEPNSRAMDGKIPPIQRHAGSPEIEKEAFKLKKGEISAVIQVGLDQHVILKCEGRTTPTVTDIEDVRDILVQELREEKIQEAVAKTFQKIKNETRVDNYVTGESNGGNKIGAKGAPANGAIKQTSARQPAGEDADDADEAGAPPATRPTAPARGARPATGKAPRRPAAE